MNSGCDWSSVNSIMIGHLFAVDAEKIRHVCICLQHVAEGRNGTSVALRYRLMENGITPPYTLHMAPTTFASLTADVPLFLIRCCCLLGLTLFAAAPAFFLMCFSRASLTNFNVSSLVSWGVCVSPGWWSSNTIGCGHHCRKGNICNFLINCYSQIHIEAKDGPVPFLWPVLGHNTRPVIRLIICEISR